MKLRVVGGGRGCGGLDLNCFKGPPLPVIGFHLLHFRSISINLVLGFVSMYCNSILGVALLHRLFLFSKSDPQRSLRFSNIGLPAFLTWDFIHNSPLSLMHPSHVS